jgi:LPXTG-motif cell wall-anchored protein
VSLYYGGNVAPDGTSADTYGFKIGDNGTQTFGERTLDGTYLAYRALPTGPFDDGEFDSYSVQQFDADYPAVAAGTDLSNMVDERAHDGGLLGAWDLGTAPGTYDRQVQVFAGKAQAALTGQFSAATAQVGDTVDYTIDVFNPFVAFLPGSQFDFTVPTGATVTTARSTCAGGMGFGGSPVVEVRGITARNMSSPCQVVVSMTFAAAGTATADASNVNNLGAADNQVTADSITITGGTVVVPPPVPGPGPVTPPTTDPVTGTDPVVIPVTGTVPSATGTTQVTPQALATTGADTGPILTLGAGLLAAGAGAVLVGRRRKAASN